MLKLLLIFVPVILLASDYNRNDWGRWTDLDKDCQDTRQEVLIQESLIEPVMDETGCSVLSGRWFCVFTGKFITDPSLLDIDHLVPLREAHDSGAKDWVSSMKKTYFNYLQDKRFLIVVDRSANRSKGARSPDQWMPPFKEYWCSYLKDWIYIKEKTSLEMDSKEKEFIIHELKKCKN